MVCAGAATARHMPGLCTWPNFVRELFGKLSTSGNFPQRHSLPRRPPTTAYTIRFGSGHRLIPSDSYLPDSAAMDLTPTFNDLLQKRDAPPTRGKFSFDELEDFLKEAYRIVR